MWIMSARFCAVSDSEISLLIRDEKPAVSGLSGMEKYTLFQALPKKDKMELVVSKGSGIGSSIHCAGENKTMRGETGRQKRRKESDKMAYYC